MSTKAEVKNMITRCEGLSEIEKSALRRFLDQNIVSLDSMTINGNLIEISDLKLVISDNQGNLAFLFLSLFNFFNCKDIIYLLFFTINCN